MRSAHLDKANSKISKLKQFARVHETANKTPHFSDT